MGTYMDSTGKYRNYENKVVNLLKSIAEGYANPDSAAAQAAAAAETAAEAAAAATAAAEALEEAVSDVENAVTATPQTLTVEQQVTAQGNISAGQRLISANWCISSGKWSASNHCYIIRVKGGEHVRFTPNSASTTPTVSIAALTSCAMTAGAAASYSAATGWTANVDTFNGETFSGCLPADARYLYVYRGWGTAENRLPLQLWINGEDVLSELKGSITTEVPSIETRTMYGYINSSSPFAWTGVVLKKSLTATNVPHFALIPVQPGDTVEILGTASTLSNVYTSVYAFVKKQLPVTGTAATFSSATGFTSIKYVDKGKYVKVTAPADAELLYIYRGTAGEREPAALRINGIDMIGTLAENVAEAGSGQAVELSVMQYNIGKYTWGSTQNHLATEAGDGRLAFSEYIANYREMLCAYHPDLISMEEYLPTTDVLVSGSDPEAYNTEDMGALIFDPVYPYSYEFIYNSSHTQRCIKSKLGEPLTVMGKWYTHTADGTNVYTAAIISHFNIGGKIVCFVCAGLPWEHTEASREARLDTLGMILDEFAGEDYCFIALDMNNGGVSGTVTSQEEGQALLTVARAKGYDFAMGGYLPFQKTYINDAEGYDNLMLDNIIFRANGKTVLRNFRVLMDEYENLSSDHVPVIADFVLL